MDSIHVNPNQYGTFDIILHAVQQYSGIDVEVLVSKWRKREVVVARQIAMWLACREDEIRVRPQRFGGPKKEIVVHRHTLMSLKKIGQELGGRDHSTIIHGRDFIQGIFDTYYEASDRLSDVEKEILRTAQHLDWVLGQAKLQYEKIQSGGTDLPKLHPEGEDGRAEDESSKHTEPGCGLWLESEAISPGGEERDSSGSIDNGEGSSLESGIVATHFGPAIPD